MGLDLVESGIHTLAKIPIPTVKPVALFNELLKQVKLPLTQTNKQTPWF
jgi:hypothetical protein